MENENAIRQLLEKTSVPVAKVIRWNTGQSFLGQPLLVTDGHPGRLLSSYQLSSRQQQQLLTAQMSSIRHEIATLRSSRFGPASLVARGSGYIKWYDFFQKLVEDLLEDGEDVQLNLPYIKIRENLANCRSMVEEPRESILIIRGLDKYENTFIVEDSSGVKIIDLDNLSDAMWVDPEFDISRRRPGDESVKHLL